MPTLAKFYGISIKMYFQQKEHNPPHIHAIYNDNVAIFDIETCELLEGALPPKALSMVKEWMKIHKNELKTIWNTQEFVEIEPLQ